MRSRLQVTKAVGSKHESHTGVLYTEPVVESISYKRLSELTEVTILDMLSIFQDPFPGYRFGGV